MKKQTLLFLLMLMPMVASADVEINGIYYNLVSKAKIAEVTNGGTTGRYSGNIVIPSSVTYEGVTYSVTTIYSEAFKYCFSLSSISIPNSVTNIGSSAFQNCLGLTSVIIPNSVTSIGNSSFYYCCNLSSLTIPNSVTSIGNSAFYNCYSLSSVTIPNSVTSIGFSAFYGCSGLTSVTLSNSVTSIGSSAFYGCSGLTSVTIPNSVTSIGGSAFYGCSGLTSVTIPNSVKYIHSYAFYECNELKEISLGSGVKNIYEYSFASCKNLEMVKCPAESVPSTSTSTFDQSLIEYATLYVPKGSVDGYRNTSPWSSFGTIKFLTDDGSNDPILVDGFYYVFDDENGTATVVSGDEAYSRSVTIPASVTNDGKTYTVVAIGEGAFQNATGLTSVSIPSSVTSIGDNAFKGCGNLTSVTVAWTTPIAINSTVFPNSGNATLHVPDGSESAYSSADYWKEFKNIVELENGVPVKCEKPVITILANGKVKVESATEGATCVTNITASNAEPLADAEISLNTPLAVYTVTSYATKEGYDDSEVATSTFRWEKTEGDMNGDGIVNISDVVKLVNMILGL